MTNLWSKLNTVLILAAIVLLFYFKGCLVGPTATITHSDTTITQRYDSNMTTHEKSDIWHHEVQAQYNYTLADSEMLAKIIGAYFKIYFYSDTTRDTTAQVEAIVNDTVTQNSIRHRKVYLKNLRPQTVKTITNTVAVPPHNKWFIGADVSYDTDIIFSPSLLIMNKNEDVLQAGYAPLTKTFSVGYFKKISLRSRK